VTKPIGHFDNMVSTHPASGKSSHDRHAPFWAIGLGILCVTGLASTWIDLGAFWKGYGLDMTGPAWNYILFRGRFTSEADNCWTRFFTPHRTIVIFLSVCFGIEGAQYFNLYDSTFDPWDLLAYVSILIPLFILDVSTLKEKAG
jgi:hypothetical protein